MMLGYKKDLPTDYDYDPQKSQSAAQAGGSGARRGRDPVVNAGPAPLQPNSKRIAEMIQNDWAKSGGESQKSVSYE